VARISFIVLVGLGVLIGIIFAVDPALDLAVASSFRGVAVRHASILLIIEIVRDMSTLVVVAAIAPAVIAIAMKAFWPKRPAPMSSRGALFLILSLAIGPGLLVNGVLKEGWGRPRPGMVTELGGDYAFKPWWDPRGACDSNCSFVSGETSSAIWLAAPAVLAPPPWRTAALGAALLYGAAIGFLRMLAGGHFLSDVIFAGIFTGLVIWAVHGFFYRWPSTWADDQAIDGMLERIGSAIMRLFGGVAPARDARPDKPAPPG
jgi:lipid A 4'-phosphatase